MSTQTHSLTTAGGTAANVLTQKTDAWLLQYAPTAYIALPLKACQEIVDSPEVLIVPGLQDYTQGMMRWRDLWLPLLDLRGLLTGQPSQPFDESAHCLVVAYYAADQTMQFVALSLPYHPYLFEVSDGALCALPANNPIWPKISASCFRYQNHRVPIVDGSRLFAQPI